MSECADIVSAERVLLDEINNRVNNEFAAAISVVSLAAARNGSNEVKTALAGVTELLHDCADVHRALQMPEHDASSMRPPIFATFALHSIVRSSPVGGAAMAARRPLLAVGDDYQRTDDQCGPTCFSRRRRRDSHGGAAYGCVREMRRLG
jgi:hypothetical protein